MNNKIELLAPAGNMEKLKTALHFGADAVYLGGKQFGLRAFANNFEEQQLEEAVKYVHEKGKKVYITVNIFAKNSDIDQLKNYFLYLEKLQVDAVIISDPGVVMLCRETCKNLEIHLSTQANTLNYMAVNFWEKQGVKRIVLARELCKSDIAEIHEKCPNMQLEIFIHGAMCISYSGRCLLSNYLNSRDSNRGECVQACRWEYKIHELNKSDKPLEITEDDRGTYLLNSKDLCLMKDIDEVLNLGVCSLKIEGRMKSEYYVGSVVSAYRRAIDAFYDGLLTAELKQELFCELEKTGHRDYTTAYFNGENPATQCYESSVPKQNYIYVANVLSYDNKNQLLFVEMRNRFKVGDSLEILAAGQNCGKNLIIEKMYNEQMQEIEDAYLVQQKVYIRCNMQLEKYDMLTRKK